MARLHSGNTDLDIKAREFCVSVARLNKAFNTNKPLTIQMLSLWENLPTELKLAEGGSEEILVSYLLYPSCHLASPFSPLID